MLVFGNRTKGQAASAACRVYLDRGRRHQNDSKPVFSEHHKMTAIVVPASVLKPEVGIYQTMSASDVRSLRLLGQEPR